VLNEEAKPPQRVFNQEQAEALGRAYHYLLSLFEEQREPAKVRRLSVSPVTEDVPIRRLQEAV
jgi:hypothetical protein